MQNAIYGVSDTPPIGKTVLYGLQTLLACFGATVLVPILVGISPDKAVFSAGIGTLLYLVITGFKVPNFTGSSFAFIAVGAMAFNLGPSYLALGALTSMLMYVIVALIVWKAGYEWINKVLPPAVIGSVVAVIGLSLAGSAVGMAFQNNGVFDPMALLIAAVTLAVIFICMFCKNRFIGSISILIGLVAGYVLTGGLTAAKTGASAFWTLKFSGDIIQNPLLFFTNPFNIEAGTALIVAASFFITSFATIVEHIGHTIVTGDVIGVNVVKNPGLHRTLLGDGLATGLAGLFGSVANTTYGEGIGVMATTKVYSVTVYVAAAITAIILSCIVPFKELLQGLPNPVLGGACILLYGTIAANGLKQLVINNVDFDDNRNMVIVALVFILGCGGAVIPMTYQGQHLEILSAIALSALVGILLNLILPKRSSI
jgi:uracil permease